MVDSAPVVECVVAMRSVDFTSIAGCIQRSARDLIKRINARREPELYLQRQGWIIRGFIDNPLAQQDKDDVIAWKVYFVGQTLLIRQDIVISVESDPIDFVRHRRVRELLTHDLIGEVLA